MRPTRPLAALPLTLLAIASSAPAAAANSYTVTSCTAAQRSPAPWVSLRTSNMVMPYASTCGLPFGGMYVQPSSPLQDIPWVHWGQWALTVAGSQRIRRIRGTLYFKQDGGFHAGIFDITNNTWLWGGPNCIGACEHIG